MLFVKLKKLTPKTLLANTVVRWWIVGLFFSGLNIPLLYFCIDVIQMPKWLASILASELANVLRFFINDRWVFGFPHPTWGRFGQYHVAIAGAFVIWLAVNNSLMYLADIHYILAAIFATCASVCVNMVTNFLWIWRKKH